MKSTVTSRFVLAVATFLAISLVAQILQLGKVRAEDFPFMTWTGWTIRDFLKLSKAPDVVLLGSSLVLVPFAGADADALKHRIDGSQHHRSLYFESKFAEATAKKINCFNFALPGEMPTDAYLIVRNLLTGKNAASKGLPKVIIYGVGPRDFLDNLLPSPAATDPYRNLIRFGSAEPYMDKMLPDPLEKLDYHLGRICYFYGQRDAFSDLFYRDGKQALDALFPFLSVVPELTHDEYRALLPEFRPCEVKSGTTYFRPTTPAERTSTIDNLGEYRKRYKSLKWDTYLTQLEFFSKTLKLARQNGIQAVVVSMPITQANRDLLSQMSWDAYKAGVAAVAKRNGAIYLDLHNPAVYPQSDFSDTVHLHSGGGAKLIVELVERLSANEKITAVLDTNQKPEANQKADVPLKTRTEFQGGVSKPKSSQLAGTRGFSL